MSILKVTITGKAGAGKTNLARKIKELLEQDDSYRFRKIFILHDEEYTPSAVHNLEVGYPDGIFIYD